MKKTHPAGTGHLKKNPCGNYYLNSKWFEQPTLLVQMAGTAAQFEHGKYYTAKHFQGVNQRNIRRALIKAGATRQEAEQILFAAGIGRGVADVDL